ncbi:hypothetical protein KIW84_MT0031 (mitochondrion) [Lathyrus oleraceus]|nr:hypothetical protein KIW84_MT0031 [Pisum sativum]
MSSPGGILNALARALHGSIRTATYELKKPPTDALRPIIPDNACILCLTAAAGTELADAYSPNPVIFAPPGKEVHDPGASTSTRHCSVRLSPIAENSPLLPPVGVWTLSQSQCG